MIRRYAITSLMVIAAAGAAAWGGARLVRAMNTAPDATVPAATVRKTSVAFTVTARGQLQGGNSRMLQAPMTGMSQLVLTELRNPGELVQKDEVVAQFDTTEETFKLREAEADLAEAEQQVLQADNEALAKLEELNAELAKARADLKLAEIESARNPLLAVITARQNELALEGARERLQKLERDDPQRRAAAKASVQIQEAGRKKATLQAEVARRNIENMTLRAPVPGYVNVERNTNSNWFFPGMTFPLYQVGDAVRPGMGVIQIPDMASWEITAPIAEQDRGYVSPSQPASVTVVAIPGRPYRAKVVNLGGTTGPPWNRRFECKLSLENPSPDLRPGMSVQVLIETGRMDGVLAIPAQALFERDGKPYVFLQRGGNYSPRDVRMVRRSESQVVIEGLEEGDLVALASPDQKSKPQDAPGAGATKAIAR